MNVEKIITSANTSVPTLKAPTIVPAMVDMLQKITAALNVWILMNALLMVSPSVSTTASTQRDHTNAAAGLDMT